jgi:hypothetical protein
MATSGEPQQMQECSGVLVTDTWLTVWNFYVKHNAQTFPTRKIWQPPKLGLHQCHLVVLVHQMIKVNINYSGGQWSWYCGKLRVLISKV